MRQLVLALRRATNEMDRSAWTPQTAGRHRVKQHCSTLGLLWPQAKSLVNVQHLCSMHFGQNSSSVDASVTSLLSFRSPVSRVHATIRPKAAIISALWCLIAVVASRVHAQPVCYTAVWSVASALELAQPV